MSQNKTRLQSHCCNAEIQIAFEDELSLEQGIPDYYLCTDCGEICEL
jgi:hypothetical protein